MIKSSVDVQNSATIFVSRVADRCEILYSCCSDLPPAVKLPPRPTFNPISAGIMNSHGPVALQNLVLAFSLLLSRPPGPHVRKLLLKKKPPRLTELLTRTFAFATMVRVASFTRSWFFLPSSFQRVLPRLRFARSLEFSFFRASIKAKLHQNLAIWVGNLAGLRGAEIAASKTCLITRSIPRMLSSRRPGPRFGSSRP